MRWAAARSGLGDARSGGSEHHLVHGIGRGGSAGGIVVRYDVRSKKGRDVEVWPVSTMGHPAKDVKVPLRVGLSDSHFTERPQPDLRVGSRQFVHMTVNGGQSWELISPDLTLNDKTKQQHSGGLTGDNIGVEYGDVIYSIAESPVTPGVIWAGTNDGLVQLTRDGGKHWTNVTKNVPGMVAWGTVSNIEPSRFHAGSAYLTVNAHQEGNFDPWVYKTTDFGATWTLIVNGLPRSPVGYARCVREDPRREGLLYLGTENAIYISFDDGAHWDPMQLNLPRAPVSWLTVQDHFHDLVVATYGRGFYVDSRRHHAARAAHAGDSRRCGSPVRAAAGVPFSRRRLQRPRGRRRSVGRQEPGIWRVA